MCLISLSLSTIKYIATLPPHDPLLFPTHTIDIQLSLTIWSKSNTNESMRPTTSNSHKELTSVFINNTTFSIHMLIPNHVHINTQHITILVSTKLNFTFSSTCFFSYNFSLWNTFISFFSFLFFSSHQEFIMLLGLNSQVLLLQVIIMFFIFHFSILQSEAKIKISSLRNVKCQQDPTLYTTREDSLIFHQVFGGRIH
jgi:hypothetical protein